jgi:hypothetical protein
MRKTELSLRLNSGILQLDIGFMPQNLFAIPNPLMGKLPRQPIQCIMLTSLAGATADEH